MVIMVDYIIALIIIICEEFFKHKIKKIPFKIVKQLMFIMGCISLFFTSAFVSKLSNKEDVWVIVFYGLAIIQFFLYLLVYVIKEENSLSHLKSHIISGEIKNVVIRYRYQIAIFSLTFISRVWQINTVQKWDSEVYYNAIMKACDNFNFTVNSFLEGFKLVSHPSHGYGFWTGIGAFLFPSGVEGILVAVLLLTCIANVKLFELLKSYWITMTDKQAFLGTVMCMCIPLYWGACSYLMPDYLIIVFLIFMFESERKKNWLTFFFWSIMACFSKEIGIVMVCAYFAAKVFYQLFTGQGNLLARIVACIKTPAICVGILDGVIVAAYLLINKGISSWKHSVYYSNPISWNASSSSETLYNAFGIQADNIITRLKQYFVVNFAWIFSIILIFGLVVYVYRRKTSLKVDKMVETSAILIGYGIFMCLFVTSAAIRYNLVFSVLFPVMAYVVMIDICSDKMVHLIVVIASGLLFVQSFYSIDIVTNKLFTTIEVGNTKLLCISQAANRAPTGDYFVTNLQYITVHKNMEKMLQAIDFTENDILFMAGEDHLQTSINYTRTDLFGKNNTIRWNKETGSYSNQYNSALPRIRTTSSNVLWGREMMPNVDRVEVTKQVKNTLSSINEVGGRLFVYFSPFYQSNNKDILLEQLEQVFELGEIKYVETWGNRLEFCELFVKPESEMDTANWDRQGEALSLEQKERKEYYSNLQKTAVSFTDGERDVTAYGDTIAVTILIYENGKLINLGYTPRGAVLRSITLGTNQVFTAIEEALVNQKVGEEISVVYTFPEDYQNNREIAGKTLELRITINAIQKEVP